MLRLDRLSKDFREAGALNQQINLYGFIDEHTFLTKTGDVGVLLEVQGLDYESLDSGSVDTYTKRLESAMRLFDDRCRLYQYLYKRNRQTIPHESYENAVVNAAIQTRIGYLESKADHLYSLTIYYAILFEGFRYRNSLLGALAKLLSSPREGLRDLSASLSAKGQVLLIEDELSEAHAALHHKTRAFIVQVSDFMGVRLLPKAESFSVLKKLLNFSPAKLAHTRLKHDNFLDYYVCESQIECHRKHLRVDDYYVRVLTLKEPPGKSFPLILKGLLDVRANFYVVTEWTKESPARSLSNINSRRRHFHNTKRSLISQMKMSDGPEHPSEMLIDDSKEAQVRDLGGALKELELKGNYFGQFSLSVVVYDEDDRKVETGCAEIYKVFSVHDAQLYDERYNLLHAFLAAVPGNYMHNFRYLSILNTNYADFSFLFTLHCGEAWNGHLKAEYLAVLETNHQTPYFFNLHQADLAHTIILGRTGSGKSFLLNFLITNLQKYSPFTLIFDLGGSFESLTRLFSGVYLRVGIQSRDFRINPFCLPPEKENLDFLYLFVKVLAESGNQPALTAEQDQDLYQQIENLYNLEPELRTLGVLANTLPRAVALRLQPWVEGGQFGFLFDNPTDNISFAQFQCFDFEGMKDYQQVLEPLLFYILHRANTAISDPSRSHVFKAFFIDEAWIFFRNRSIHGYITRALRSWRKRNGAVILSTQSLEELRNSGIVDILIETCPTKIFLANPDLDLDLYQKQFHLNDKEIELLQTLIPKRQMLIKTPKGAKVANLNVDPKSYWLYTNDPYDNKKRQQAFDTYGFERGLEILAGEAR